MRIRIEIESEGRALRALELADGEYSIGAADCDIVLSYPTVSRRHGTLRIGGGSVAYLDRSSRNGSWLLDPEGHSAAVLPELETAWGRSSRLKIGPFALAWAEASARSSTAGPAKPSDDAELERQAALYQRWLAEDPTAARSRLFEQLAGHPQGESLLERIHGEFHGDGPLDEWLERPDCREILINSFDEIYVDVGAGPRLLERRFVSRESFEAWAARTAHSCGRRLDLQHPICEATLPGGARFHAVVAPVSARGLSVAVRRFGSAPIDERAALESGWLSREALELLRAAVLEKQNVVISGGTSTGKTSLLNFLCRFLPADERIVTVEDTVELAPPVRNLVQLQARSPNADGVGEVSLRQLVQCALRLRPDRIIVGECRGAEVLEMLQALNTGHPGSLTTVHANSADEALKRLELLALLGAPNLSIESIRSWISSSVGLVVQVARGAAGRRFVAEIAQRKADGRLEAVYRR